MNENPDSVRSVPTALGASRPSPASNSSSKFQLFQLIHLFISVFLNVKNYRYIFNFSRQFLILCISLSTQPTPRSPKRLKDVPKVPGNREATRFQWLARPRICARPFAHYNPGRWMLLLSPFHEAGLMHRKVKDHVYGDTASEWQSQDRPQFLLSSPSHVL